VVYIYNLFALDFRIYFEDIDRIKTIKGFRRKNLVLAWIMLILMTIVLYSQRFAKL